MVYLKTQKTQKNGDNLKLKNGLFVELNNSEKCILHSNNDKLYPFKSIINEMEVLFDKYGQAFVFIEKHSRVSAFDIIKNITPTISIRPGFFYKDVLNNIYRVNQKIIPLSKIYGCVYSISNDKNDLFIVTQNGVEIECLFCFEDIANADEIYKFNLNQNRKDNK